MKETEDLKKTVDALRELGEDWKENTSILRNTIQDDGEMLTLVKRLNREENKGSLIKIGLACLAFPEPIVSDVLGYFILAAGLAQRRIKNSALYLEDVYKTFPRLFRDLHRNRQEII